jgi:hypothetical protein
MLGAERGAQRYQERTAWSSPLYPPRGCRSVMAGESDVERVNEGAHKP